LILEDDRLQAELTAHILQHEGYTVAIARTGVDGLAIAQALPPPDLVLVDIGLPDLSGTEVVRRLRAVSNVPIIVVTAKRQLTDKVVGLDAGADDFVAKPFEAEEVLARVRAQLRRQRYASQANETRLLEVGPLVINTATHRVTLEGQIVHLSPREFAVLRVLAEGTGRVVTRRELLTRVWGSDFYGDEGALDVYVRRLRTKIEANSSRPRYLHTVRGTGFRLADERVSGS
jgi:DNA-binding response OmpR family regulator